MKILYFCPDRGIPVLGEKGASVHVRSFVTALARQGHEVVLACTRLGSGNPPPGVPLIELPPPADDAAPARMGAELGLADPHDTALRSELRKLAHDAALRGQVRAALAARGFVPELMYERHALFNVSGVAIARALRIPRLLEVNAPIVQEQARFRGLHLLTLAEARETASLRQADLVIAVSDEIAAFARGRGVDACRVMVAPNGVDTASFAAPAQAGGLRARLGLGMGPVIGFIGSFKPWHGVDVLLEAFARLAPSRPHARLLAVGDGPMLAAARAQAAAAGLDGRVVLTGAVPHAEVPAYLAAMDLTAAPYTPAEDFYFSPLKVVESLAAGRPVVAPLVGQLPSLVVHGQSGLLYRSGDTDALTACLAQLLDDPGRRARMGAAGARQARQDWDWQAVAARIIARAPLADPLSGPLADPLAAPLPAPAAHRMPA
jgi:glycosyltransferase involved in cell wall biosynthesis